MGDPRFKTIKYGERGRDWDMQIALTEETPPAAERIPGGDDQSRVSWLDAQG